MYKYLFVIVLASKAWGVDYCRNSFLNIGADYHPTTIYSAYDPETRLWGVSSKNIQDILSLSKQSLGENLIDVYVIGSRAQGIRSPGKGGGPPTQASDLDLVFHLKTSSALLAEATNRLQTELKQKLPFSVEVHTVAIPNSTRLTSSLSSYHAGDEAHYIIVEKNAPPQETGYSYPVAIRISD